MKIHSLANKICLLISIICLGTGYILNGHWLILSAFFVMALLWLVVKKRSILWAASSLLLAYVFLASMGILIHLSVPLMIVGCILALASWEMTHFSQGVLANANPNARASLEKYHLQALSIVLGASLLLSLVGAYANLQLSFGFVVIIVLFALGSLTKGIQYFLK